MPGAKAILDGLKLAANDSVVLAILWHVAVVAGALALMAGWRPSRRLAGLLFSAPVTSAALVAFIHRNPFNGSLLGALGIVLVVSVSTFDRAPLRRGPIPFVVAGAATLAFGLFYPHFLDGAPAIYLVAAPAGVIPCPTLSLVIGLSLLVGGFESRTWCLSLAVAGLFYGAFGVFRLGVLLDAGLMAGACVLVAAAVRSREGARGRWPLRVWSRGSSRRRVAHDLTAR